MQIKLFDPFQPQQVKASILEVLESGCFVKGPLVAKFEQLWASRCGMKYAIGVSSGAMALELVIQTFKGKTITYSPETFRAVPNAIRRMGKKATPSLQPILYAHHLHDQKPDYIPLIEDCSHCHGYKPVAETAVFSFFPTKILGACGEAGIIITNNQRIYEECLRLRSHKDKEATNARMDEIQAAVLLAKFPYLDTYIQHRKRTVELYDKGLGRKTDGEYHYAYCIMGSENKKQRLLEMGIESAFYYTPQYMALPLNPFLIDEQIEYVIQCALKL